MARWNDAVVALVDEQGITQAELARLSGLHPDTVSHVIHEHCSTETLEKLAAALGVDIGELFASRPMSDR
jgi:transcriptional regulator with XRE-family HTH domain